MDAHCVFPSARKKFNAEKMRAAAAIIAFAAGCDAVTPWCSSAPQSGWTVCNTGADIHARAADIVSRISPADKILALNTDQKALNSVGLPAYK